MAQTLCFLVKYQSATTLFGASDFTPSVQDKLKAHMTEKLEWLACAFLFPLLSCLYVSVCDVTVYVCIIVDVVTPLAVLLKAQHI